MNYPVAFNSLPMGYNFEILIPWRCAERGYINFLSVSGGWTVYYKVGINLDAHHFVADAQ